MTMHNPTARAMGTDTDSINECADGTICENYAPCLAHPTKEGSYMCDCFQATDANKNTLIKFAGPYCEHQATSYCEMGRTSSEHAFCTNGGECKHLVTKTEEHAGCKCMKGYEGDYCQFVEGSRPSDWELSNYMHPSLATAYGSAQDNEGVVILALMIGALVCFVCICVFALGYVYLPSLKDKLDRNEKEKDTGPQGFVQTAAASHFNTSFVGGKSVRKKNTTTSFVTGDTMDPDGGVLTAALGTGQQPATMEETEGLEDVDVEQTTSLEEVTLDDEPSSKLGEMA